MPLSQQIRLVKTIEDIRKKYGFTIFGIIMDSLNISIITLVSLTQYKTLDLELLLNATAILFIMEFDEMAMDIVMGLIMGFRPHKYDELKKKKDFEALN